jgi:hypothetical protein
MLIPAGSDAIAGNSGHSVGIAVLRAAGEFDGAGEPAGVKVPVSSSQPCRAFGAAGATIAAAPRSLAVTRHPQVTCG